MIPLLKPKKGKNFKFILKSSEKKKKKIFILKTGLQIKGKSSSQKFPNLSQKGKKTQPFFRAPGFPGALFSFFGTPHPGGAVFLGVRFGGMGNRYDFIHMKPGAPKAGGPLLKGGTGEPLGFKKFFPGGF